MAGQRSGPAGARICKTCTCNTCTCNTSLQVAQKLDRSGMGEDAEVQAALIQLLAANESNRDEVGACPSGWDHAGLGLWAHRRVFSSSYAGWLVDPGVAVCGGLQWAAGFSALACLLVLQAWGACRRRGEQQPWASAQPV